MFKYLYFLLIIAPLCIINAQIGIRIDNPLNTLDIGGTLRIREIEETTNISHVLATTKDGIIEKVSIHIFDNATEEKSVIIESGKSTIVVNETGPEESSIVITSRNSCSRQMITTFISYSSALAYVSGVARTVKAVANPMSGDYSINWDIKFPNTTGCGTNSISGGATQFDFSFEKIDTNKYLIKNNGDVNRTYNFSFMKL